MGRLCFTSSSHMRFKLLSRHCDGVDGKDSVLDEQDIIYYLLELNVSWQVNRVKSSSYPRITC
jgi:hypothetical protein